MPPHCRRRFPRNPVTATQSLLPQDEVPKDPLAVWMVIDPGVLDAADAAAREHLVSRRVRRAAGDGRSSAFSSGAAQAPSPVLQKLREGLKSRCVWTEVMMETLQRWVGEGVELIWQYHMQQVSIPPGKVHAVANLLPCVKVAADGMLVAECLAYVQSIREVRPYVSAQITDYGAIGPRLLRLLLEYASAGTWPTWKNM